jgi:hypothetical protein
MEKETIWNIALDEIRPGVYRLIMPDQFGELTQPYPQKGYVMHWPVNPNFTGESGIKLLLSGYEKFKDCTIL